MTLLSVSFLFLTLLDVLGIGLTLPIILSSAGSSDSVSIPLIGLAVDYFAQNSIAFNLLLLVIVWIVKGIFGVILNYQIFQFAFKNQKRLIDLMSNKYQCLSVEEFVDTETSSMIQNLIVNIDTVTQQTIVASCKLVAEVFAFMIILMILIVASPLSTLVAGIILLLGVIGYFLLTRTAIAQTGQLGAEARVNMIGAFNSLMGGFKEIKVLGVGDFFDQVIEKSSTQILDNGVKYKTLSVIPKYLFEILAMLVIGAIFVVTSKQGLPHNEVLVILSLYAVATIRLVPAVSHITGSISQMRNSLYPLNRVSESISTGFNSHELVQSFSAPTSDISQTASLCFQKVSFSYPSSENTVFRDAGLDLIGPGLIALVGESGSGKSTAFDLMLGFRFPDSGSVVVGGFSTSDSKQDIYSSVAYSPQEGFIFPGTVKENIVLGRSFDADLFEEALRYSCLDSLIKELPQGAATLMAENGLNFSGGQRQRLAVARAIYSSKPLMLLDEPTSALDFENTSEVIQNLKLLSKEKLIIVCTHDIEVIASCDRVLEIKNKQINLRMSTS
tara:strand:- start:265 stop:1935 length:1671 start_codon:yes stop_codon:yes gene_type:complete